MTGRRIVLLAVLVCLLAGAAGVASGHAYLVDSSPASGEQLETAPDAVSLEYTEGVQIADVEVIDGDGNDVSGEARIDESDTAIVRVPLEDLDDGVYTVRWEVLADDGHTTSGTFLFVIGEELPDREQLHDAGDDEAPGAGPLETGLKGLVLVALAGLVGVPLTLVGVVFPAGRIDRRAVTRIRQLLGGGAALLFVAGTLLGSVRYLESHGFAAGGLPGFLSTPPGTVWAVHVLTGGVLLAGLWRSDEPTTRTVYGSLATGVAGSLAVSAASHSASVAGAIGTLVDLMHLLGAGVWVGGLLTLGVVGPHVISASDEQAGTAASMVRRFSIVALAGVTAALTTGLFLAAWHLPALRGPETAYENALVLKTALVVGALGIGGLLRVGVHRHLTTAGASTGVMGFPDRLASRFGDDAPAALVRGVRLEAAVLVVVLLLSGLLTSAPTAAVLAAGDDGPTVVHGDADGYEFELQAVPAEVGPNAIDLTVTRDGEPAAIDEASVLFGDPISGETLPQVDLEEREPGTYSNVTALPTAGVWDVRANVWTDEGYVTADLELFVAPAGGHGHDHDDGPDPVGALQLAGIAVGLVGTAVLGRELWRFEP